MSVKERVDELYKVDWPMSFKLKFVSFCQLSLRWRNVVPSRGVTDLPVLPWKGGKGRGGGGSNISYLSWQNVANRSHEKQGHPPSRVWLAQPSQLG